MRIIADVDTGIDDALALIHLASHPDAELLGVSTSCGNASAEQSARNTAGVLSICGRDDVPIVVGARQPLVVPAVTTPETHGESGLGYAVLPEHGPSRIDGLDDGLDDGPGDDLPPAERDSYAVRSLWLPQIRAFPGEITLLITGPLTNLALALQAEPRLPELVAGVVIMGGAFNYPGNTTPSAEWNSWCDPHAAAQVYQAFQGFDDDRLPIVCSLGVTEQITLRPHDIDELARRLGAHGVSFDPQTRGTAASHSGVPLIDLIADSLRFYFEFHDDWGYGYLAQVHDLLAAQIATGDITGELTPTWVGVETESELTRGTTVADLRHLLRRATNARIVTAVDADKSIALFSEAVIRAARD